MFTKVFWRWESVLFSPDRLEVGSQFVGILLGVSSLFP